MGLVPAMVEKEELNQKRNPALRRTARSAHQDIWEVAEAMEEKEILCIKVKITKNRILFLYRKRNFFLNFQSLNNTNIKVILKQEALGYPVRISNLRQ